MKYAYDIVFQESIIKFILNVSDGRKGIPLVVPEYFTTLEHHIIYTSIQKFWTKHNKIISLEFMIEDIKKVFDQKEFEGNFTFEEQKELIKSLEKYFDVSVKHGDLLLKEIANFASFVEMQALVQDTDLSDYNEYEVFAEGIRKAIKIPQALEDNKQGGFLIKDLKERQFERQIQDAIVPTPFHQVNRWTNAGGYSKGSMIVLIDKAKNLKTFNLIQVARGYLRRKKKILFIDLENGQMEIFDRIEQSIGKIGKKELLSGKEDKRMQKILRRYKRLGGELHVRRLPNLSTAQDIQAVMDEIYQEHGIIFDELIIDYIGLMGSFSNHQDDFKRISDAMLDVANLAFENGLEHIWTAMHVTRDAWKRSATKYRDSDMAKSIDILRHAQAIFGIQRNEEEVEANLLRWEVISQRDGFPDARAYFEINVENQFSQELTKAQVSEIVEINKQQNKNPSHNDSRGDE